MVEKVGASYGRTSKEKDDAFSIASQLRYNREYAERAAITIPADYEFSEDFTGRVPGHERPAYRKILQLIRDRQIQALIVYKTDRFARELVAGVTMLNDLFAFGIELHIAQWGGPVRNIPADRDRFELEMYFSGRERRDIVERTQRGKREKIAQGMWVANGPVDKYGFRRSGKKRQSQLIHVPEEIAVVRSVFAALDTGQRVRDVVRRLNASGTKTPGKAKGQVNGAVRDVWSRQMVYHILRNEAYIGVFYAYKEDKDGRQRPKEECSRLEFPELAIIERSQFERVQRILNTGRERYAPNPTNSYLLARRIRCAKCKKAIASETNTWNGKRYSYYRCLSHRPSRNDSGCPVPNVRADHADTLVWAELEDFLRNPQKQADTLKQAQHTQQVEYAEALEFMKSIEHTRTTYERNLKAYYEDYCEGLITKNIYLEKKAGLDHRLQEAETLYRECEEKLRGKLLTDEVIADTIRDLANLREELEALGTLTFTQKQRLMQRMNITSDMDIDGDTHILQLYVHRRPIAQIDLGDVSSISSRRRCCRRR